MEVEIIFIPNTKKLTPELLQKFQNLDTVITQLKSWHKYKTKPIKADITVLGNETLLGYFRENNKNIHKRKHRHFRKPNI